MSDLSTSASSPAAQPLSRLLSGSSVSIVIPCRNERGFIGNCLDSILANDYPKDALEILVVDGMSDDGTREVVASYSRRNDFIRLIDNPRRITPCALNIGIAAARGEIVMRMDAHATYSREYISRCADALERYAADEVGGVWSVLPRDNRLISKAVAKALSHPFGAGGGPIKGNGPSEPKWVDAVALFCCRRETLLRVGPINERLTRNQDMDFNNRLRRAGGKILMVPGVVASYYPRSELPFFFKHSFDNGFWTVMGIGYSDVIPASPRHFIPLALVLAILASALLALVSVAGRWLLLSVAASYAIANGIASVSVARQSNDARYLAAMPPVFGALHFGWGIGSLWGLTKLAALPAFWRQVSSRALAKR